MTLSERIRDTAKAAGMYGTVMDEWANEVKQLEQENSSLRKELDAFREHEGIVLIYPQWAKEYFPTEPE